MIRIKSSRGDPEFHDSNQVYIFIRIKVIEIIWVASVQSDSNQVMWLILIKHTKSEFFIILKWLWDFSFHLTSINNTHGSYSTDSCNWIKASWSSSNITIVFCILKTKRFKLDLERMYNHEGDSMNESKWKSKW